MATRDVSGSSFVHFCGSSSLCGWLFMQCLPFLLAGCFTSGSFTFSAVTHDPFKQLCCSCFAVSNDPFQHFCTSLIPSSDCSMSSSELLLPVSVYQ
jgi:hypothetical protein